MHFPHGGNTYHPQEWQQWKEIRKVKEEGESLLLIFDSCV